MQIGHLYDVSALRPAVEPGLCERWEAMSSCCCLERMAESGVL